MQNKNSWTILGISELGCWLGHKNPTCESSTGHDAEDCLEAHVNCNIRNVAWDLGRSVLNYHSDIPESTCKGLRHAPPGLSAGGRAIEAIYRNRCQLRAALRYSRANNIKLYGRLCMNRHYSPGTGRTSKLVESNPQWYEHDRDGWLDVSRVCYGIPEYRRERINILMEAADIGVDGLHLDFCRQPPMVRYHPALVNGYRGEKGRDPRAFSDSEKEDFLDWCRYRSEVITSFMRELKEELLLFRERWQRPVPVQARIPNDGFEANLIAGLDVIKWCEEDLIDELALSELHWLKDYQAWDDHAYVKLGQKFKKPVYASSNCLPRQNVRWKDGMNWGGQVNPHGVNPWVLARRALRSYETGADGVALYQSDTGVQWPGVREAVALMSDPDMLRDYVNNPEVKKLYPLTEENKDFGIDNHSC